MKYLAASFALTLAAVSLLVVPATIAQDPVDFERDVFPIFLDKCLVCHGPVEVLGELRLDSKEAILEGGEIGEILVAGEPEKSSLYVRSSLPSDDIDVMPAEGDLLKPEQIETIRRWIAEGADFGEWVGF